MAPKQALDRSAWQWAEQTDPTKITLENILTAYRIILPTCPFTQGVCRKNCVGSPNCYSGLGERMWMEKNLDEELAEALNESSKGGNRTPGTFIGLKNLGATCYANTFLQVWFHNPEFRRGILDCSTFDQSQFDSFNSDIVQESDTTSSNTSVVKHLQLLFALLSFSERQYIDPSSFIECLHLDTSLQQDAQEFSKLFISLLEDQLPAMSCHQGVNLIQRQFVGHYEYVTRCSGCGQQSRSSSKFYEIDLNIKGHTNLAECLQEFLQEEKLDGENQYYCQFCEKKQDAVRRIHLIDLPPTLNFQLLRFVFDRQTQNKKKLLSYLQFPEVLDMNEYISNSETERQSDFLYDLVSVLIHRGPGAHSGHYVAVVKDCHTNATYQFNDEEVEKLADNRFRLDKEEDSDVNKTSQKKPRPLKGYLCSRNAYMLVYRRRNTGQENCSELTLESLSPQLQLHVQMDNQKHEEALRDQLETRKFYISKEREKQDMVKHFYNLLEQTQCVERNDSFEWISTNWLKDWMAADSMGIVTPVDNVSLLCPHEKMHPDNVDKAKLIPSTVADLIFEKFGGCLRLQCTSSMCHTCVEEKCRFIHSKVMITEDSKTISQLLKSKDLILDCSTSYWVGKNSLKKWRGMAEDALQLTCSLPKENGVHENDDDGSTSVNMETSGMPMDESSSSVAFNSNNKENIGGSGDATDITPCSKPRSNDADTPLATGAEESDCVLEDSCSFNEDLLCSTHGNLTPDLSVRRLVTQDTWFLLKKYFPKAPEFINASPVCLLCQTQDEKERRNKEQDKVLAAEQRQKLMDLYLDKKRPSSWLPDVAFLNVISVRFLEEWRKFIRDPVRHIPVSSIDNVLLLCHHGGFMYDVNSAEQLNNAYVYIWPSEWTILSNYTGVDTEIIVTKCQNGSSAQQLTVYPDFCQECCRERQEIEYSSQFTYENETIFVRKVTDETMVLFSRTLASKSASSSAVMSSYGECIGDESDDADLVNENGKRKHNVGPVEKSAKLDILPLSAPIRRSLRKGRIQDDIKFEVSSTLTLKDLKLQLVKAFAIMKMDQHLFLDGIELSDESATLEQLKILPGSILYLQADEPSPDVFIDASPVNLVEEGFKGTGLVGR